MTLTVSDQDQAYVRQLWQQVSSLQFEPIAPPILVEREASIPPTSPMIEVHRLRTEIDQRWRISKLLALTACVGLIVGAMVTAYLADIDLRGSAAIAISACIGVALHWTLLTSFFRDPHL